MQQMTMTDPQQLGAMHNMGGLRTEYKPSRGCLAAAIVISILVLAILLPISFMFGTRVTSVPGNILPLLPILFVALILTWAIVSTYKQRNLRVLIYEQGLIHLGREAQQVIRWEQIAYVWHKITASTTTSTSSDGATSTSTSYTHEYIVQCFDGSMLTLDSTFSRLQEIGKQIEIASAGFLLPGAQQAFNTGQPLVFGTLAVNQTGITCQNKYLPWNELKRLTIDERTGDIAIKKHGKWFGWGAARLSDVPNIEVFKALVRPYTGV